MKHNENDILNYNSKGSDFLTNQGNITSQLENKFSLTIAQIFYSKAIFRTLLVALMMVCNFVGVWAQTDYSGTYYIASRDYNSANTTSNFYLCPTEGWAFFVSPSGVQSADNSQPFLTTYKCKDGVYDATKAVWVIEKAPNSDYYYIKQKKTDRYLITNNQISTAGIDRMRVHLESVDNLANQGDKVLFDISLYKNKNNAEYLVISPQGIKETGTHDNNDHSLHRWLTVNGGNVYSLKGESGKTGGPTGYTNTKGIVGIFTQDDANAPFYLEDVLTRPTISFTNDNKIQITHPTDEVTIKYTTDDSTPTSEHGDTYSEPFDPADGVTTIKAIAIVNGEATNVTTFTPPVLLGSSHTRLIQSQANGWETNFHFYMIPSEKDNNNIIKVNTTSLFRPTMEWYFLNAGDGYYYIVNNAAKDNSENPYYLCWDGTNVCMLAFDSNDANKFKFSIVESPTAGSFNISPYADNKKFINKNNNNINAAADAIGLRTEKNTYSDAASARWKFILPNTLNKTAPFTASDGSSTSYYKIENISKSENYIVPPTGTSTYAEVTASSEASSNWYFEVATPANENDWLTYYYIRNAKTGDYLYFSGTANNNAYKLEMRQNKETGENAKYYQFTWARTASTSQYYIVPMLWKDRNLNQIASLQAANNATTLSVVQTRTAGFSAWEFDASTYKCATPTITFNGSKYVISKTESDAKIKYTINDGTTWLDYTDPFDTPSSACTIRAYVYRSGNENDKSDEATFVVTKVETPVFDYSAGNSIAITCATPGATIYYTIGTNPDTPTTASTPYTEPITGDISGKIVKAIAVKAGSVTSEVATSNSITLRCATPVVRRGNGNFALTCSFPAEGVTIKYSYAAGEADPGEPTETYSTPVSCTFPITIKAIATASGYSASEVLTKYIGTGLAQDENDVYLIETDGDLAIFVNMVNDTEEEYANAHYKLTADVSGSGISAITRSFTGIFESDHDNNGNYYKISGLTHALFNTVDGGTVKNVMLDDVAISGGTNVGAIANEATGAARIYNCGVLATGSTVTDGAVTSVSSTISGSNYVGSIVGLLDGEARVINCFSFADITGGSYRGGIVGYNNVEGSNSTNLKTMVMNCMYYGNMDGGNKAPIYNGYIITNDGDANGVNNFNYFRSDAPYVQSGIDAYNCALAAETRFLQRFEFFRPLLNSNRELAAWWATGSRDNKEDMLKWVMEPSQIGTATPFPILKAPSKYYPSVVNIDAEHAPTTSEINKGRNLGTLTVTISGVGSNAPSGATLKLGKSSLSLTITDKDPEHFNFNYYKVQLPYYNEVGTGNYTHNKVVTGWKVTVSGGTHDYTTGPDATASVDENGDITLTTPYNFADRKSTGKDNYATSGRIFNQGAYFDVPDGVSSISIEPYWGKCVYVADAYPDVVYNKEMKTASNVTTVGGGSHYTNNTAYSINGDNQTVYTTMSAAVTALDPSGTVYDNAIVLVGNVHSLSLSSEANNKPYTIMSIDLDKDNEPDYSYILRFDGSTGRVRVHPVRIDFLNVIGLGMAQKTTGGKGTYNFGIMQPFGWFEVTNTGLFRVTQFEYDRSGRANSPMILQGGVIEQWVTVAEKGTAVKAANSVSYYHVGGNVWFKEFHLGVHQDKIQDEFVTPHPPISITGGDFKELYLTGLYSTPNNSYNDNAECYINGGHFGKVAGTGMEGIGDKTNHSNGNIIWQIDNADMDEFYAGGINAAHIAEGNITTVISNSRVDQFCGGPKFGNMNSNKKVTTNAENCTFRTFFGAGFGGNSYNRRYPDNKYNAYNYSWNAWVSQEYTNKYDANYKGVETRIDYQFIPKSDNTLNVARLFVDYVSFSLATTYDVTSKLSGCTITKDELGNLDLFEECTGNFYGGGSLGKVAGNVKSTLTNCTVAGNVFGAGYSASLPSVDVMAKTFQRIPSYDENTGAYTEAILPTTEKYHWVHKDNASPAIDTQKKELYTTENLNELGTVTGQVTLNIDGTTAITGNVYGGGQSSDATSDVEVNVKAGSMHDVYGGGQGETTVVGGTITVNVGEKAGNGDLSGSGSISGDVYGGSALGAVNASSTKDADGKVTAYTPSSGKTTNVNIYAGAVTGSVFGGGLGQLESGTQGQNGYKPAIAAQNFGNTIVTMEGGTVSTGLYGGANTNGVLKRKSTVTIIGGTAGTLAASGDPNNVVFGGGYGAPTLVEGDVEINLGAANQTTTGATINGSIYGGGAFGNVNTSKPESTLVFDATKTTTVNLFKGTVKGNVYGGGLGQKEEGTLGNEGYKAPIESFVGGDVTVELNNGVPDNAKGCIVEGSIFGCNNANGTPKGSVTVHIYGTQYAAGDNITDKHDPNPPYYTKGRKQGEGRKVYLQRLIDAANGFVESDIITAANSAFASLSAKSTEYASTHDGRSLMGREDGYLTDEEIAIIDQYLNPSMTAIENALDATKSWYDVLAVYGGGNEAEYKPTDKDGKTVVVIDGCDRTSIRYVYGGGNAAAVPATDVTINSAKVIDYLFGGGNGERGEEYAANVGYANEEYAGTALTKLIGGTIYHAFGGSNSHGDVINGSNIEMPTPDPSKPKCTLTIKEIYGAGQNAHQSGGVRMILGCVEGMDYVYGGAKDADIEGGVTVVITSGTFKKIFGGNNESGVIRGPIKVSIEETACDPIIIDELYLGGNLAPYSIYGYYKENDEWKPRTSATDAHAPMKKDGTTYSGEGEDVFKTYDNPILDVVSCTSIGKVFGGGYGATAIMYGSPTVNINMIKGAKAGEDEVYVIPKAYESIPNITKTADVDANTIKGKVKDELGTIGDVYGGGCLAKVVGNTTVNIGASSKVTMESRDGMEATVEGANVIGNVYGGGQDAEVTGNTQVNICAHEVTTDNTTEWQSLSTISENITIAGSVFGAGEGANTDVASAIVRGNSTIQMGGGWVKQNIYGGGKLSCVGSFTFDGSDDITACTDNTGTAKVNIFAGKVGPETQEKPAAYGHVYGAGKGNDSYPKFNYAQATDVTISGSAIVEGSVFGGSENGHVRGNTNVAISGGTIGVQSIKKGGATVGNVYGGGQGSTEHFDAGIVKGNTNVTISGGTIYHNIYGGGAYGSVGTITLGTATYVPGHASVADMPTAWDRTTDAETGKATITVTGGTIGQDGDENGMIFGSSRGDVATPAGDPAIDPNDHTAWVYDTEVTIGTNGSETGPTIFGSVYGSGENGHVFNDTDIKIYSGIVGVASGAKMTDSHDVEYDADDYPYRGNVYGGGCGEDKYDSNSDETPDMYNPLAGIVLHNTNITITGGHVVHDIYGAGALGSVGNKSTINISGGRIGVDGDNDGNVYGAARGDLSSRQANIARVQETEVNILPNAVAAKSPVIWNDVFGGGQAGIVKGSVAVNVSGGTVKNDVYGGGALADTNTDNATDYGTNSETISSTNTYTTTVKLTGGLIGNAYGGGLGQLGSGTHYTQDECNAWNNSTNITTGWIEANTALTEDQATLVNTALGLTGGDAYTTGGEITATHAAAYNYTLPGYRTTDDWKVHPSNGTGNVKATVYGDVTLTINEYNETTHEYGTAKFTISSEEHTYNKKSRNAQNQEVITPTPGIVYTKGRVFGCNNINGTPKGNVTVTVWKTTPLAGTEHISTEDGGSYEVQGVYGGGNLSDYVPIADKKTTVNIHGCGETSIQYVFGGGNAALVPETHVNVYGTFEIEAVFGGGNGNEPISYDGTWIPNPGAEIGGDTNVRLMAGLMHQAFGGSFEKGIIRGLTNLVKNTEGGEGCPLKITDIFGGGKDADVQAVNIVLSECNMNIIPGVEQSDVTQQIENVYAGSYNARIFGDVTMTVQSGTFKNVFGGNYNGGFINGQITLNVEETSNCKPVRITNLYGGGNYAPYPGAGANNPNPKITVNVKACTSIGNVYGGSFHADVTGDTEVNINMIKGWWAGKTYGTGNEAINIPDSIGTIGNVYGGGDQGRIIGNTVVNIGNLTEIDLVTTPEVDENTSQVPTQFTKNGNEKYDVLGAKITGNVFGGGNQAEVTGNTYVNISTLMTPVENSNPTTYTYTKVNHSNAGFEGLSIGKSVYGGGNEADVKKNTNVTMSDGYVYDGIYGGGLMGSVGTYTRDKTLTTESNGFNHATHTDVCLGKPTSCDGGTGTCTVVIDGGQVGPLEIATKGMKNEGGEGPVDVGFVFGGGRGIVENPAVDKDADFHTYVNNTDVTISGGLIMASVYGGGENGRVFGDTHVKIKGGQIGSGDTETVGNKTVPKIYTDSEWTNENPATFKECLSWDYKSPFLPYDPYEAGDASTTGTDGHTYYGSVFGGGSGYYPYEIKNNQGTVTGHEWLRSAGAVYGNTVIDITGGHILTCVYGGNETTDVGLYTNNDKGHPIVWQSGGKCTINMVGGTIGVPRTDEDAKKHPVTCYLFGGGKGDQRTYFNTWTNVQETEVNVSGRARIFGSVFGGGEDGHILGNAVMNIGGTVKIDLNGDGDTDDSGETFTAQEGLKIGTTGTSYVDGNVFGGGRGYSGVALTAGSIGGNVDVNITGGTMLGSVYGGGRLASVGIDFTPADDPFYGQLVDDTDEDADGVIESSEMKHGHINIAISGGTIGSTTAGDNDPHPVGGNVFGGSMGRITLLDESLNPLWPKQAVVKRTNITISGGEIKNSVYGGSEYGIVRDKATVYVQPNATPANSPVIHGNVYGGGYGSDDNTPTLITAGDYQSGTHYIFTPMIWTGCVSGDTEVNISGGKVKKNVYGGGEMASVGLIDCSVSEDNNGEYTFNEKKYSYNNIIKYDDPDNGFALSWPYKFTYIPADPKSDHIGGKATVTITNGRIGTDGNGNGYVFGGSKGKTEFGLAAAHASSHSTSETSCVINEQRYVEAFCANVRETEVNVNYATTPEEASVGSMLSGNSDDACIVGAVYGGGEDGHVLEDTKVDITGGLIGYSIYGGGKGIGQYKGYLRDQSSEAWETTTKDLYSWTAGKVYGNTAVVMHNGYVIRSVYGGGYNGSVGKGNYASGTDDYYPHGYGEKIGNKLWTSASTGDNAWHFLNSGKTSVTIEKGTIGTPAGEYYGLPTGQVFGGARGLAAEDVIRSPRYEYAPDFFLGYVNECEVKIGDASDATKSPIIYGSVYGGGRDGHVRRDAHVIINNGTIGLDYTDENKTKVGESSLSHFKWKERGNVFGAGSGIGKWDDTRHGMSSGSVTGKTTVDINGGRIYQNVYGGGAMASVGPPRIPINDVLPPFAEKNVSQCVVNINGGHIGSTTGFAADYGGCVYGASRGGDLATYTENNSQKQESADDFATTIWTKVNINPHPTDRTKDATIEGDVYGGGQAGRVQKDTEVHLDGGIIKHDAYGGGRGTLVITESNGIATRTGGIAANVSGNTTVELNKDAAIKAQSENYVKGCIVDQIFGGNNLNGSPKGHIQVHVYATQNKAAAKATVHDKFAKEDNGDLAQGNNKVYLQALITYATDNSLGITTTSYQTTHDNESATAEEIKSAIEGIMAEINAATIRYDVKAVYGGGNLAAYVPNGPGANNNSDDHKHTTEEAEVIIEGCDLTSIYQVYGGGDAAATPATKLIINSAYEIFEAFGGGNGNDPYDLNSKQYLNPGANVGYEDYTTPTWNATDSQYDAIENNNAATKEERETNYGYGTGIATTNVRGGTIHTVFGGSNKKGNIRKTAMSVYESSDDLCPLCVGETYGAGKEASMDGDIDLTLDCVKDMPIIYGGAKDADVNANITLNITNGTFEKVFGGNNTSGAITGSITVNVEERGCQPIFIKELYGGGYLAPYSIYGYEKDNNGNYTTENINGIDQRIPLTSGANPQKNPRINIISATRIDNIYGGGYQAKVVGSPRINVNMQEGTILAKYMDDEEHFVGEHTDNAGNTYTGKELGELVTLDDATTRHTGILTIGKIGNIFGGGNQADIVGDTYIEIGTGRWINGRGILETLGTVGNETEKKAYIYNVDTYNNDKNKWGYETTTTENETTTTTFTAVEGIPTPARNAAEITGIVYGGGNEGDVTSNTYITMENGSVYNRIFGGGNMGNVGTITSSITPTGHTHAGTCIKKPDTWEANTGVCNITISGGRVGPLGMAMPDDYGYVFGAGRGDMKDPAEDPDIDFRAYVKETHVTINGTALICGGVYGGSENGRVRGDTHVNIAGGQVGVGEGETGAYAEEKFFNPVTTAVTAENALAECAHWKYEAPHKPYDEFAAAEGGATTGSDGHTFYGNVFGGGSGYWPYKKSDNSYEWLPSAGQVEGDTHVNVTGGHILTSLYGGNDMTNVTGTCNVTMTGGTLGVPRTLDQIAKHPVTCYLFGAGKGDQRTHFNTLTNVGKANVKVGGNAIIYGSIFGGGEDGHVLEDVNVEIQNNGSEFTVGTGENEKTYHYPVIGTTGTSYVDGNIFGGGRGFSGEALTAGSVGGNTTVDIKGGTILGSIYGGGRLASVGTHFAGPNDPVYGTFKEDVLYEAEDDDIPEGKHAGDIRTPYGHVTINISGGTIGNDVPNAKYGGNVYGGSMGRLELLNGLANPVWAKLAQVKTTAINISGNAHIKRSVYGGGEMGTVRDDAYINMSGTTNNDGTIKMAESPTIEYNIFGGGYGSEIDDDTYESTIQTGTGVTAKTNVFRPIEFAGCVGGDTHVNISGGLVKRTVYGGGEMATVGLVDLEKSKSQIHQDVNSGFALSWPYEYAFVQETGGTAYVNITGGRIGLSGKDKINSEEEEDNGDIYGGGKGIAGDRYEMGFCGNVRNSSVTINVPTPTKENIEIFDRTPIGDKRKWTLRLKKLENTEDKIPGIAGSVYGGAEDGHVLEDAVINITNGYIGHSVYGGGKGKGTYKQAVTGKDIPCNTAGKVYGNTAINMTGGWIMRNIYGGGNLGSVGKGNYAGGTDDYYPNGYGEKISGNLWTTEATSADPDDAWHFLNSGKATVNVFGGTVGYMISEGDENKISVCDKDDLPTGNVFGGCRGQAAEEVTELDPQKYPEFFLGYVNETEVNIGESAGNNPGPRIYGSVYGGAQDGHVRRGTNVIINKGEIGIPYNDTYRTLMGTIDKTPEQELDNLNWLHRGNIYGGGSGIGTYEDGEKHEHNSSSAGSVTHTANVTVNSGITGVAGTTTVGNVIYRNVYGGGSLASVSSPFLSPNVPEPETATIGKKFINTVNINGAVGITDENVYKEVYGGEVYGAGRGDMTIENPEYFAVSIWTKVHIMNSAHVMGNVFGGGDNGKVLKDSEVIVGD